MLALRCTVVVEVAVVTVNYGGISHISSSSSGSGTDSNVAPHLGLPSLPQCIALGDR